MSPTLTKHPKHAVVHRVQMSTGDLTDSFLFTCQALLPNPIIVFYSSLCCSDSSLLFSLLFPHVSTWQNNISYYFHNGSDPDTCQHPWAHQHTSFLTTVLFPALPPFRKHSLLVHPSILLRVCSSSFSLLLRQLPLV